MDHVSFVELHSPDDPLLAAWVDLYENAFPPEERIPVERILAILDELSRGKTDGRHLLASVDAQKQLNGMMFYEEPPGSRAAFLWYFAVIPHVRGQGLGRQLYRALLARLNPETRALIFDLEDPNAISDPAGRDLAERRVRFYQRLGARLLGGIRYDQRISPEHPWLHLRIMVQPIADILPQEAFYLAKTGLGEAVQLAGTPIWES